MFCSKCGKELKSGESFCSCCGVSVESCTQTLVSQPEVIYVKDEDRLPWGVIALIWIFALFPLIGGGVVVILSSILYYTWRKEYPKKARSVNSHGLLAFLFSTIILLLIYKGDVAQILSDSGLPQTSIGEYLSR